MNIYDDYANYLEECQAIMEKMHCTHSPVLFCLEDVLKVTDYIYQLYLTEDPITDDMAEIFEIGYGYLSNCLADIKTYFHEYFQEDIVNFNQYAPLMVYAIYVEDYRNHLDVNENLTEKRKKVLEAIAYKIDGILTHQKPFDTSLLESFDNQIDEIKPADDGFRPVYNVFELICEELDLLD